MNGLNKAKYSKLLTAFLPRTMNTLEEYQTVQEEVDRLIDKGDLSPEEEEYLDLLGALIWAYEARRENRSDYELR